MLSTNTVVGTDLHLESLADRERFRRSLADRAALVTEIADILREHNPVELPVVAADEFRPEAETIAKQLDCGKSLPQVHAIVHQEFVNWFDAEMAGPAQRYEDVADAVWRAARRWFAEQADVVVVV